MFDGAPMLAPFELLLCVLFIFMVIAITAEITKAKPTIDTLGYYAVTTMWPDGSNDDVDLYVRDPVGDIVWFNSQDEGLMHLEADDRGTLASGTQFIPIPGTKAP